MRATPIVVSPALLLTVLLPLGCASPCQDDGLVQEACAEEVMPADGGSGDAGADDRADDGAGDDAADGDGDGTGGNADGDGSDDGAADGATAGDDGAGDDGAADGGDGDDDDDGVPNGSDNCEWTPNAMQDDEDGDGVGDMCDTDTRCGPGMELEPLTEPTAVVSSGVEGACILCSVQDVEEVVDEDLGNGALVLRPADALDGLAFIQVTDDGTVHPAGVSVGFVIAAAGSLTPDALSDVDLVLLLDGEVQEISSAVTLIDLGPLGPGGQRGLVVTEAQSDFDAVRIELRAGLTALDVVEVDAACVGSR